MRGSTALQLLRYLGLVSGLLCMLVGCGGNSGSSGTNGPGSHVRQLSLQLVVSPQFVSTTSHAGLASAAVRQVQPGDPAFIERLEVRLQAHSNDLVPLQVFPLDAAEQETVTREVMVPDTVPATFQVLISSFNNQGIEVFRGSTLVARGQDNAVVTLVRNALVPIPATPANLQHMTFQFQDGTVFGLAHVPVTLATGAFVDNVGDFALVATGFVASGQVVLGSCTFQVTTSTFPVGQGPQGDDHITIDPCQIDAIDKRLIVTNVAISATPTISNLPSLAPSENSLNLPNPPPSVALDEDTFITLQIAASLSGDRPGAVLFSITTAPAHGTAMLTNTGVLTYQPVVNFNGSDRLVVTVVVSFSDDNFPPLLLGTVPISIMVRPVNNPPRVTTPGNQTTLEGTDVSLPIVAQDVDGDQLSFSISIPPAHGTATVTPSGLAIYTPQPGFTGADSFTVTVTDNGTPPQASPVAITVTVINRPPVPTALAISTPQNTVGTSQLSANDPDVGQTPSFSVATPPAHGTATVTPSGLAIYTPQPGFTGADSFTVTVTDNGTPPQASPVAITVTVINRPPVPTALAISTPQNTVGTSQLSANDPDVGQTPSFSVATPPAHGTATVTPSGLAIYTPQPGFTGADSFTVTVTDNGTPPRSGTETIAVTVKLLFGTDANSGNLLTIDPATGAGTIVGSLGVGAIPALAIDPTTGTMYAATGGGNPSLYKVNPVTGATTLIGSTGLGVAAVGDIAFRADGTLYAAVNIVGDGGTGSDTLVIIDKTTGKATVIGPFGVCTQSLCTIEGMEAITFNAAGTLLGALSERGASSLPGLYKIDPTTGTATFFAPILDARGNSASGGVVSLQFCSGTLFGGTARAFSEIVDDGGRLITINPATGLFAFVGTVSATGGSSLGALACQ